MSIGIELGSKLTFLLAITNAIGLGLVASTCRCVMGKKLTAFLWSRKWYRKYYNVHCYFWYFLLLSVSLHLVFGLLTFGIPF